MEIAQTMIVFFVSCFVLLKASPVPENGEEVSLRLIRHQSDHRVRRDAGESSMPDVLVMQFPLKGETVILRLQRARFPPMFMVGKNGLREITGIDDELSSVYSDPSRGASFMVKKSTDGQFLLDGNFRHQHSQMEMKPVTRKKRSAVDDNSHTVIHAIPEVIEIEHNFEGQESTETQETEVAAKRRKRQAPFIMHTVETAFVVDHTDYAAWQQRFPDNTLNQIRMFYTQIGLTINNIYASVNNVDPALDIRVPITALYVVESSANNVSRAPTGDTLDGSDYLTDFVAWIPTQANLISSDHYMAFTAYDISLNGGGAAGVANVGEVCTARSAAVVENSFKAIVALIAAHELGHTLSAGHDGTGDSERCSASLQKVMSPVTSVPVTAVSPRNIFEFSECSVESFKAYLAGTTCTTPPETSASVALPFTDFNYELITDRDRQCQEAINDTRSSFCDPGPFTDFEEEDICTGMLCDEPGGGCRFVLPFEGTSCGTDRICSRGLCEDAATVTQAAATFNGPTTAATTTPETTTTTSETTTTTPETTTTTPETTTTTPETTTTTPETTTTTPETTTTTPETTTSTLETTTTTPETSTTTLETTTTTPETTTTTPETTTTTPETTTTTPETTTTTPETTTTTPETTTTRPETTTTTPETTTTTPETTTTTLETTTTTPETTTTTPETTTTTPETTTTTPETTTTTLETTTTTPETTTTTPETTTTTPETTTTTLETTTTTPETSTTTLETTTTTPETTTTTPETTTTTLETTTTTPETTTTTLETTTTTPETTTTTPETTTTTTPETTTTTPETTTTTPETTTTTTPETTTTTTPETTTTTSESTTTTPETTTTTSETTTTPETTTTTPETTTSSEFTTETSTTPASTTDTTTTTTTILPSGCRRCNRFRYYACFGKYIYSFFLRRPLSPCCRACLGLGRARRRRRR